MFNSHIDTGQIVSGAFGKSYCVASKVVTSDSCKIKLIPWAGKVAFNRDFDLYILGYVEQYNKTHPDNPLPFPTGPDGKLFRWADWFQTSIAPYLKVKSTGDAETLKDEAIHDMIVHELAIRGRINLFGEKIKNFHKKNDYVKNLSIASQLTVYLTQVFRFAVSKIQKNLNQQNKTLGSEIKQHIKYLEQRLNTTKNKKEQSEIKKKIQEAQAELNTLGDFASSPREMSMWVPSEDEEGEINLLDQDQFGVGESDFQAVETKLDVDMFRKGFGKWLSTRKENFESILFLFDLFWVMISNSDTDEARAERGFIEHIQSAWIKHTGLTLPAFTKTLVELPKLMEMYIKTHVQELGDKNTFVTLMQLISGQREKRLWEERRDRMRARPAYASSLNLAAAEEQTAEKVAETKIAQLIAGTDLTPEMRKQIEQAFMHRWTYDNPHRSSVYSCGQCDVAKNPYVNENSSKGHPHPTIPLISDEQWIREHAFNFTQDGRLGRGHAEPVYLAQHHARRVASIEQKFAIEKAAYNSEFEKEGMLGHDFNNADGQAIRDETLPNGRLPHVHDETELTQPRIASDEETTVARIILEQLGGGKFIAMTGARNFVDQGSGLSFTLPGGSFTKNGINIVRIDLTSSDTYKISFLRKRGDKVTTISEHDDVYVDVLREVFERETGLRTSLGTMGRQAAGSNSGDDDVRGAGDLWREEFYERQPTIKPKDVMNGMLEASSNEWTKEAQLPLQEPVQNPQMPQGRSQPSQPTEMEEPGYQQPGPHSPNAPSVAPRSPSMIPRVVSVPPETVTSSIEDIEPGKCAQCGQAVNNAESDICPQCQAEDAEDRIDPFIAEHFLLNEFCPNCGDYRHNFGSCPQKRGAISPPNLVQNMNVNHPQQQQIPGMMVPNTEEDDGGEKRHTVEPELHNAKYYMMAAPEDLVTAEEAKLAKVAGMNTFKVFFEDGNSLVTGFNGTLEEAEEYYLNNEFNFGDTETHPKDHLVRGIAVEQV